MKTIEYTIADNEHTRNLAEIIGLTTELEKAQTVFTYRQIVHYRNNYQSQQAQIYFLETMVRLFEDTFYRKQFEKGNYDISVVSESAELKIFPLCTCLDCVKS